MNDDEPEFIVELYTTQTDLVRVRFHSRHSNKKNHVATVQFDEENENPIRGYYCTCVSGARDLGCCVHVAAVLWHMGVQRAEINPTVHPLSAVQLLQAVNDSIQYSQLDDESDHDEEDIRYAINQCDTDNENETANSDDNTNTDSDE